MKNNLRTFVILLLVLMAQTVFIACSGDGNLDTQAGNKVYFMSYDEILVFNWEQRNLSLKLHFGEGIPAGSEWYLKCDAPWIKPQRTSGRISNAHYENIPIKIEKNLDYQEREAYITLDVPNGIPSGYAASAAILQNGLDIEFYDNISITIVTNRSTAESSRFSINNIIMPNVMDVDWGDEEKTIRSIKDFTSTHNYSISHNYTVNGTTNINLRFGFGSGQDVDKYFSFKLDMGQGVECIQTGYVGGISRTFYIKNNKELNVYFKYTEEDGFRMVESKSHIW